MNLSTSQVSSPRLETDQGRQALAMSVPYQSCWNMEVVQPRAKIEINEVLLILMGATD